MLDSSTDRRLSELLARAQDGDRAAYEAFLAEAMVLVRAFVRRRMLGAEDLEDVVQDTLLALHRYRHTYDPRLTLAPWLYAIARHRMLAVVKRRRRRAEVEQTESAAAAASGLIEQVAAPAPPLGQSSLGALASALKMLSAAQVEVIRLLKIEGYTVAEIAMRTGRSPAAVKVTAHRGYKVLRKALRGAL